MVFLGRLLPPWLRSLRILPVALTLENESSKHKKPTAGLGQKKLKEEWKVAKKPAATISQELTTPGYLETADREHTVHFASSSSPMAEIMSTLQLPFPPTPASRSSSEGSSGDGVSLGALVNNLEDKFSVDIIDDFVFTSFDSMEDLIGITKEPRSTIKRLHDSTFPVKQCKTVPSEQCTNELVQVTKEICTVGSTRTSACFSGASTSSGSCGNSGSSGSSGSLGSSSGGVQSQKQGSASTGLSKYQMIRERNIAQRERLYKELGLESISKLDHLNGDEMKTKRRKKCTDTAEKHEDIKAQRKSSRSKQPVTYCIDDEDPDWMPGAKKKNQRKKYFKAMIDSYRNDNSETENTGRTQKKSRRPKRSRKEVTYEEDIEPRADEFIYCDICQEAKHHGCKIHPVIFDYEFNFDVGPSRAGKNAGDGVFNRDSRPIPQGVLFGKYAGKFYDVNGYNKMKKLSGESGNAWALRDRDLDKIVGYVDPGWKPNIHTNWMAYVNCASKKRFQNLWPGQYTDGIYYRAMRPIQPGEELLTYYGDSYAKDIKIKVPEMDFYERKENWAEKGVVCEHCNTGFTTEENLKNHTELASTSKFGCKVLGSKLNQAFVSTGLLPYVCDECGKGFDKKKLLTKHKAYHRSATPCPSICPHCGKILANKAKLKAHINLMHVKKRDVPCPLCDKKFRNQTQVNKHLKSPAHNEEKKFKCPTCGQTFASNGEMKDHIQAVHNRELSHKCDQCGKRFNKAYGMKLHKKTIHDNIRDWICEDCDQAFVSKKDLNYHRTLKHTFNFPFHCLVCDQGFMGSTRMMKHIRFHHPDEFRRNEEILEKEKPAVCSKCGKRFKTKEEVVQHTEKMHS